MLARNLLGEGHVAEAEPAAERAVALASLTDSRVSHFEAILASSLTKVQSGKAFDALRDLQTMLAASRKMGFRSYEYQALLVIGEIELHSGTPTKGRARLAQLERNARARGFGLIALKAASAMKSGAPRT